jgi:AraC-like DNA-binding protein
MRGQTQPPGVGDNLLTVGCERLEGGSLLVERVRLGRWSVRPHRLAFHKLTVVVSGEGVVQTATCLEDLRPGWLFLTEPFVEHAYPEQPGRLDIIQALFDGRALLERFAGLLENAPRARTLLQGRTARPQEAEPAFFRLPRGRSGPVIGNMAALYHMSRADPPEPEPLRLARLLLTIIDAARLDVEAARWAGDAYSAPVAGAIAQMNALFAEPLRLADLAAHAGWNEAYLCRRFRRETGLTPTEYLNRVRIERACHELLTTRRTIAEIAGRCGYNEIPYFNRRFKRLVGHTPSGYRFTREPHRRKASAKPRGTSKGVRLPQENQR